MLTKVILCLSFAYLVQAQLGYDPAWGPPQPYEMGYSTPTDDGGSLAQQEVGDEANTKRGSYTISGPEGTYRIVNYIADIDGFRATVETNEPGTANQNPAGVEMVSSAWSPIQGGPAPGAPVAGGAPLVRRSGRLI